MSKLVSRIQLLSYFAVLFNLNVYAITNSKLSEVDIQQITISSQNYLKEQSNFLCKKNGMAEGRVDLPEDGLIQKDENDRQTISGNLSIRCKGSTVWNETETCEFVNASKVGSVSLWEPEYCDS